MFNLGVVHVAGDVEIKVSITVHIEENRPGVHRVPSDSRLGGDVGEASAAEVAVEPVWPEVRYVKIHQPVAVDVGRRATQSKGIIGGAGGGRNIFEFPVPGIPVQPVPGCGR